VQSTDPVPADSAAAKAGFTSLEEITFARLRAVLDEDPTVVRLG
jgi:hypothetical protein